MKSLNTGTDRSQSQAISRQQKPFLRFQNSLLSSKGAESPLASSAFQDWTVPSETTGTYLPMTKVCQKGSTSLWLPRASLIIFSMFRIMAIFWTGFRGWVIVPTGAACVKDNYNIYVSIYLYNNYVSVNYSDNNLYQVS